MDNIIYQSAESVIYLLSDSKWGVPVIKKVLATKFPDPNLVARFYNEKEITEGLEIEGVRKPRKSSKEGNQHTLYLDYVEGKTLSETFKDQERSFTDKLKCSINISVILESLHKVDIIHGHLSGSNIIINPKENFSATIIDFGGASKIDFKRPYLGNPERLDGDLKYTSPEQSGRMNRIVDYRTDLYSFGVVIYEMLTGQLPFNTDDPIELIHSHMAQIPVAPHLIKPEIPEVLSNIVLKLMAKNAEDRYQSAYGLKHDLEKCSNLLDDSGYIVAFNLAEEDYSGRFQISEKLYGREDELKKLLDAFERVSNGALELMLVAGYSGTGKTALVNETHKPITQKRGYYISGKFDQFQRNVPYFAIIQAFQELVKLLLTENEKDLKKWKDKIQEAIGSEGKVITEVIPNLELIIGDQPEIPELAGKEAQNRFNYVFRNFVKAVCKKEHPLVLFIDDLQWADSASVDLLKVLTTDKVNQYLLVICAYRDNEVTTAHPFIKAVSEIEAETATVSRIHVKNLSIDNVNTLISDSLLTSKSNTKSLTNLVYDKTQGNPFFLRQFLKSLYEEAYLVYAFEMRQWTWDTDEVIKLNMTDNVVDLMAGKIKKLSPSIIEVLKFAASIGNRFDLLTITLICEKTKDQILYILKEATRVGLVVRNGNDYSFSHDRIQQAAYSLIPGNERKPIHLKIGNLLLKNISQKDREERIFDIVNQLNWGIDIIEDSEQKQLLAKMNLMAGKKAKSSAAYLPAYEYLSLGIQLLEKERWKNQYELALSLYTEAAETAYMSAQFEQMDAAIAVILAKASNLLDKVTAYRITILSFKARNQLLDAIGACLDILDKLGIQFPDKPSQDDTGVELMATMELLKDYTTDQLLDLPKMTNKNMEAALTIMADTNSSLYWARPDLFPFIVFKSVEISVKYGNTPVSAFAYSTFGVILSGIVGDMKRAYQFGVLGLNLVEKMGAKEWLTQLYTPHYALIVHWNQHISKTMKPLVESYHIGLETGAIEYAVINVNIYCIHGYLMGMKLDVLEKEIDSYSENMLALKQETNYNFNQIYHQAVLNLQGLSKNPCMLIGSAYNEDEMLPKHLEANDITASFFVFFNKFILNFLFGNIEEAIKNRDETEARLSAILAKLENTVYCLYDSLLSLALYPEADKDEQNSLLERVNTNQEMLKKWAETAPMNFMHKYLLVEAERNRVLENNDQAAQFYDRAISLAEENQFLNEEALAHELTGKYYLGLDNLELAKGYLQNAYKVYNQWGALAKMKDLESTYPSIFDSNNRNTQPLQGNEEAFGLGSLGSGNSLLDLSSMLKASVAISGEIVLGNLLKKLMNIIIENAGAQKGFMILNREGVLTIEAEGNVNEEYVKTSEGISLKDSNLIPMSVIQYVERTHDNLILEHASNDPGYNTDKYLANSDVKSVLCFPIINQGKLLGMLYLENNITAGAFAPDRVMLLKMLSGQIAVAINNAMVYDNLEQVVAERTQELSEEIKVRKLTEIELESTNTTLGEFAHVVSHDLKAPLRGVMNLTTWLVEDFGEQLGEGGKKQVDLIQDQVNKMVDLIQGVLEYSSAGKLKEVKESVDLKILVPKIIGMLAIPDNVSIEVNTRMPVVCFEPIRLQQVIQNLISNAIKYNDKEGPKIEIGSLDEVDHWKIFVKDNGPGIPEAHLLSIFKIYNTITSRDKKDSTGIGLSIAKKMVEMSGGKIWVESDGENGSNFCFTIPKV